MKSFLFLFKDSLEEFKRISCLTLTGIFIAVYMLIESLAIEIPYSRINFAFLAIAVIGMLFGPVVGFLSGGICDIVGYIVHPAGGFMPLYVLIGMLQGLIYGLVLYRKSPWVMRKSAKHGVKYGLLISAVVARLLDVVVINLFINTAANMHYGFIPDTVYTEAIAARAVKNFVELAADIPLMLVILPFALMLYRKSFARANS